MSTTLHVQYMHADVQEEGTPGKQICLQCKQDHIGSTLLFIEIAISR